MPSRSGGVGGEEFSSNRRKQKELKTRSYSNHGEVDKKWAAEEQLNEAWAGVHERGLPEGVEEEFTVVYNPEILYENLKVRSLNDLHALRTLVNYDGVSYRNGYLHEEGNSPSTVFSFPDELQPWMSADVYCYDDEAQFRSTPSNSAELVPGNITTLNYALSGSDELNMTRGQNSQSVSGDGSSSSSMPYLRYPSSHIRGYAPSPSYSMSPPPPVVTVPERPLSRSRSYGNARYPIDYPGNRTESPKEGKDLNASKKWSFGALFKKKNTNSSTLKSPVSTSSLTFIPPTELPPHLVRNSMPKFSQEKPDSSDLSSTESEVKSVPVANGKKQNFITRRLSKRKEKAERKNDYLQVPGSSNGHRDANGWETTKKHSPVQNYSSSGSYTVPYDENGRPMKNHRAKDAVKARAVARRESFLNENSSSEDDNGSSSLQGSHSSLSSRSRRNVKRQGRPELVKPSSVPESAMFRPNQSPNPQAPPSPRWEARVVYTEETIEQDEPVIIRLPSPRRSQPSPASNGSNGVFRNAYPVEAMHQRVQSPANVFRQGLQVPLIVPNSNLSPYPADDRTYANLPTLLEDNSAPPPPPRDFRQQQFSNSRQNFYRPLSCSYLDSYRNYDDYYTQNFANVPYVNRSGNVNMVNVHPQAQQAVSYSAQVAGLSPSGMYPVTAVRTLPESKPGFVRSPSEPPEMKSDPRIIETIRKRNAITPSVESPKQYMSSKAQGQTQVVSKLGYPVRKLAQANKLPATQSPVHMQASEFWRKKEQELTGGSSSSPTSQQVKSILSRNRSADNSPVPGPKSILRNSPRNQSVQRGQNSNESISSLSSSISAEAPSPSAQQNGKVSPRSKTPITIRPQSLNLRTVSPIVDRSKSPLSACERLKVRLPSANQHAKEAFSKQVVKPKSPEVATVDKVPGGSEALATALAIKATGKNLEDALNELEDMYKSLRLSDEDLLDRAERRDLPTAHQELRNAPLPAFRFSPLGSFESLTSSGHGHTTGTGSVRTGSSLGGSSFFGSEGNVSVGGTRMRAPPLRRSSRPDTVGDDMAKRRFEHGELKPLDPRNIASKAGCYMMRSPAFSPPSSPLPMEPSNLVSYTHDPDLALDDVSYRNYKRANSIKIIEPQPMFGIPLGPLTSAPTSDYLHAQPEEKYRPLFKNTKRPDIVKDDIAFRNLRKDLSQENNLNKDWTPRLFNKEQQVFTYNIHDNQRPVSSKKLRAIRSLSANISQLIPFKDSMVNNEIGKWNSFSDLYGQKLRMPNHKQPSWVEEIERFQHRTLSQEAIPSLHDEIMYPLEGPTKRAQEASARKSPAKAHSVSGAGADPKDRRPWTDVLLESFEQEQEEIERLNAQAKQKLEDHDRRSKSKSSDNLDDVFLDANTDDVQSPGGSHGSESTRFSTPSESEIKSSDKTKSPDIVEEKPTPKKRTTSIKGGVDDTDLSSNTAKFTPLPPPRKVHQIHLDSFSSAEPASPKTFNSNEDELTSLIDALVRDADSCVAPTPSPPQLKGILKSSSSSAVEKTETLVAYQEKGSVESSSKGDNSLEEFDKNGNRTNTPSSSKPSDGSSSADRCDSYKNCQETSTTNEPKHPASIAKKGVRGGTETTSKSVFRIKMPWGNSGKSKQGSKSTTPVEAESSTGHVMEAEENENGKDKSSKRKSNLNKALAEEPIKGSIAFPGTFMQEKATPEPGNDMFPKSKKIPTADESHVSKIQPKPIDNKYVKPSSFSKKGRKSSMEDGDSSSDYALPMTESAGNGFNNGITCIKRLLQKERVSADDTGCDKASSNSSWNGGIKKSPSLGSNFSWPKFSSGNSSFFTKKSVDKIASKATKDEAPKKNENSLSLAVEDTILSLNVAQKANFFMKMEHEQRFSKWRANEQGAEMSSPAMTPSASKNTESKSISAQSASNGNLASRPSSVTKTNPIGPSPWRNPASSKPDVDVAPPPPQSTSVSQRGSQEDLFVGPRPFGSASKLATLHEEGKQATLPCYASSTSVRHTPFGRDSTTKYLPSSGKFTPSFGRRSAFEEFYTPISWAPWANPAQENDYDNFGTPLSMFKRHGSTSDIETKAGNICPQHGLKAWKKLPQASLATIRPATGPQKMKNNRVRSMIMANTSDAENYSEDGEVSSGGQEVAEIISKSYDNSPMIRKKSKKYQNPAPNFGKEIWRKCFHQPPDSKRETNDIFYDASSEFECYTNAQLQVNPTVATSPPATSNLLHILNVLSSSNDDLDEKVSPAPSKSSTTTLPSTNPLNFTDAVQMISESVAQVPRTDFASTSSDAGRNSELASNSISELVLKPEANSLDRRDLPVSSWNSSVRTRNPLKVLAAKMDFKFN